MQSKSRPRFSSGTPELTTFTYDALGRVVQETNPDGSIVKHAYHGVVTIDTNELNQTRTTTKNSQSQVVSVTDAAGIMPTLVDELCCCAILATILVISINYHLRRWRMTPQQRENEDRERRDCGRLW